MPFVIIVYALVGAVLLAVVLALIDLRRRYLTLAATFSRLSVQLQRVEKSWKQSEPAALHAEVGALEGVVGKLAKSMRSQFGTIHAKLHELEVSRAKEEAVQAPGDNGERPSREELRVRYLRPPLPPTAE